MDNNACMNDHQAPDCFSCKRSSLVSCEACHLNYIRSMSGTVVAGAAVHVGAQIPKSTADVA